MHIFSKIVQLDLFFCPAVTIHSFTFEAFQENNIYRVKNIPFLQPYIACIQFIITLCLDARSPAVFEAKMKKICFFQTAVGGRAFLFLMCVAHYQSKNRLVALVKLSIKLQKVYCRFYIINQSLWFLLGPLAATKTTCQNTFIQGLICRYSAGIFFFWPIGPDYSNPCSMSRNIKSSLNNENA